MGSSLSGSLLGYPEISHKTSSLSNSHIRETVPALCESYRPFSWCPACSKRRQWSRTGYLFSEQALIGVESRYNPIEKECLARIFAVQKTRHYLVGQTIHVISRVNPLRLLMMKLGSLNSRQLNRRFFCLNTTCSLSLKRRLKARHL